MQKTAFWYLNPKNNFTKNRNLIHQSITQFSKYLLGPAFVATRNLTKQDSFPRHFIKAESCLILFLHSFSFWTFRRQINSIHTKQTSHFALFASQYLLATIYHYYLPCSSCIIHRPPFIKNIYYAAFPDYPSQEIYPSWLGWAETRRNRFRKFLMQRKTILSRKPAMNKFKWCNGSTPNRP